MKFNEIYKLSSMPKLYQKGTADMWTNKYISEQLLNLHLDPNGDIASRSEDKIDFIIKRILEQTPSKKLNILDLGCGPGLYSTKLAKKGHKVTGIDYSQNSINYAKEESIKNNLDIDYICQNYLEIDYEEKFDLIILIYCDFGVLSEQDRKTLINKIHKALKKDGIFIFDALNIKSIENINFGKNYDVSKGGFWSASPYIALTENFHYKDNKAILDQHTVILENDEIDVYRFWNHYFNITDISKMFNKYNLKCELNFKLNGSHYNDDGVTFYKVTK